MLLTEICFGLFMLLDHQVVKWHSDSQSILINVQTACIQWPYEHTHAYLYTVCTVSNSCNVTP